MRPRTDEGHVAEISSLGTHGRPAFDRGMLSEGKLIALPCSPMEPVW